MAKLTKFPLEMENGAKVRSIEELRENADVKSIVTYFLDGRLRRWCSAWRYDDLPDKLDNITFEMIKSIYDVLGIKADDSQIEAYLKENGTQMGGKSVMRVENDDEIIDDEELKSKIKPYLSKQQPYVNVDIDLSDFAIDLIPVSSSLTVIRILNRKNFNRLDYLHDARILTNSNGIYYYIALQLQLMKSCETAQPFAVDSPMKIPMPMPMPEMKIPMPTPKSDGKYFNNKTMGIGFPETSEIKIPFLKSPQE
ncbi:MAG: hypothetical protein NC340_06110 [Ruminococcus flavefaciens]|nr:hypothetical protein [Ruminococcus flavefaciens]MCM1231245.1 hypothetical protein [Ruminococcus flavefaciens]